MARKSRRKPTGAEVIDVASKAKVYPTAIYVRLSVENLGRDDGGTSIANQADICREYVSGCTDLKLVKVYEDNGWSGTVMRRPAFEELMEDVKSGIVKAIVVRDLSRFARNYIEAGTYLEKVFPELGVRFISVKEQLDTLMVKDSTESLIVPLQNLINEFYAKDISRKVATAARTRMKKGTFPWITPPYGYRKAADNATILPDEVRAEVVRKIFRWRAEGDSCYEILHKLNREGAPKSMCQHSIGKPWDITHIKNILRNPVYIGVRIMGKTQKALYLGIKWEALPPEKWFVFPDNHEAIVSRELFDKVQNLMEEGRQKHYDSLKKTANIRKKMANLFKGKIFCADCGVTMYYSRHRYKYKNLDWVGKYRCGTYHRYHSEHRCTIHHIWQDTLESKVLDVIKAHVKIALDYEKLILSFQKSDKDKAIKKSLDDAIRIATQKLASIKRRRVKLYEDYVDGILDEAEYIYAKKSYEAECETQNVLLDELVTKKAAYQENMSPHNLWVKTMTKIRNTKKLTQEMVDATIERIYIHEGGSIEIVMKYQDIFEATQHYLEGGE